MTALVEPTATSPWRGRHGRTTVGVFSLAFLFAFEALAVATVMPDVADDLDGLRWYAVAFAAPLAASVVALAAAGAEVDRRGPGPALRRGLLIFCAGVVIAGLAPSMPVFLLGRLVHGYGGGVLGVALYVVIAQAYPEGLRPRVFAVLTTAWVLPALVGPVLAAQVAAAFGWRWVFLGVPVVAVAAWLLVADAPSRPGVDRSEPGRLPVALLAAGGVLLVSLAGQRTLPAWPVLVVAGLAAIAAGARRLLPPGTWRMGPGLPAVLGSRAAIGTAFAAAEVYVPLLLTLQRELSLAQAGWVLTTGAVTWSAGAVLAARWRLLADQPTRVRLGAVLLGGGIGVFALVAVPGVPLVVPVLGWAAAGLGIGMAFSTLSVLALATARAGEEGRTSSALQLNDYLANSAGLALGGVVFAGFAVTAPVAAATGLVLAAAVTGALALVPATRLS
ncbi:MFS transporter [Nocardioides sp. QY071]|uniref:MFS transporter n=1 Tax=Nocardioides sp. QY071 TaxID=3044187 RepID=UPI00249A66AD|nr:MFS transporter [Nocardioides sp. QY071]WGY00120.1 MFS transporter [Nocardioides sp. QY071]